MVSLMMFQCLMSLSAEQIDYILDLKISGIMKIIFSRLLDFNEGQGSTLTDLMVW